MARISRRFADARPRHDFDARMIGRFETTLRRAIAWPARIMMTLLRQTRRWAGRYFTRRLP